jgi:ABC-type cobalamin/Fe3+-siderophores transport system ATPase subunit
MPIRDCTILAVEGTQAAGKTTLVHALTAHYRERGVHVGCTLEAARLSPFIDDIVLHDAGDFDLTAELDLYAAALSAQLRAARNYSLLITDKTVMNVTAYARLVLAFATPGDEAVLTALETLSAMWAPSAYDAVIFASDHFDEASGGDRYRSKVLGLQTAAGEWVRRACTVTGVTMLDLPVGLDTPARVQWIDGKVRDLGLIPG